MSTSLPNVYGKVSPPSVDNSIFTLGVFTAPEAVPATSHVIVFVEPASHSSAVVCEVIAKGPEVSSTVIFIKSKLDCPFNPVAEDALSLTVSAQFKSLLTEATVSQAEFIVGFV